MKIEIIDKPMLCWDRVESEAKEYHVLAKVTDCDTQYSYKVLINTPTDARNIGRAHRFKNAKPLTTDELINSEFVLKEGDILIDSRGLRRKILGICGKVYFISVADDLEKINGSWTLEQIISKGWELETQTESNTVKMTVAEVSKALGKEIKIVK